MYRLALRVEGNTLRKGNYSVSHVSRDRALLTRRVTVALDPVFT